MPLIIPKIKTPALLELRRIEKAERKKRKAQAVFRDKVELDRLRARNEVLEKTCRSLGLA